jgi:hypothetical protein
MMLMIAALQILNTIKPPAIREISEDSSLGVYES